MEQAGVKFKCYDWMELPEALGISVPEGHGEDEEDRIFKETCDKIWEAHKQGNQDVLGICREWVRQFANATKEEDGALYIGLFNIKGDWYFCKHLTVLLRYMWT